MIKKLTITYIITIVSRVLGIVRDIVFTRYIGTGYIADIFWSSLWIPNSIANIVNMSLTPVIISDLSNEKKIKNASSYYYLTALVIIITYTMISINSISIVRIINQGYEVNKQNLIADYLPLFCILYFFIIMNMLLSAFSNARGKFIFPTFLMLHIPVGLIIGIYFGYSKNHLNNVILISILLAVIVHIIFIRYNNKIKYNFKFNYSEIKKNLLILKKSLSYIISCTSTNITFTILIKEITCLGSGYIAALMLTDRLWSLVRNIITLFMNMILSKFNLLVRNDKLDFDFLNVVILIISSTFIIASIIFNEIGSQLIDFLFSKKSFSDITFSFFLNIVRIYSPLSLIISAGYAIEFLLVGIGEKKKLAFSGIIQLFSFYFLTNYFTHSNFKNLLISFAFCSLLRFYYSIYILNINKVIHQSFNKINFLLLNLYVLAVFYFLFVFKIYFIYFYLTITSIILLKFKKDLKKIYLLIKNN